MKDRLVTYVYPDGRELPPTNCRLHEPGCRYLQPNPAKPYTGSRKATVQETRTHAKCAVC